MSDSSGYLPVLHTQHPQSWLNDSLEDHEHPPPLDSIHLSIHVHVPYPMQLQYVCNLLSLSSIQSRFHFLFPKPVRSSVVHGLSFLNQRNPSIPTSLYSEPSTAGMVEHR